MHKTANASANACNCTRVRLLPTRPRLPVFGRQQRLAIILLLSCGVRQQYLRGGLAHFSPHVVLNSEFSTQVVRSTHTAYGFFFVRQEGAELVKDLESSSDDRLHYAAVIGCQCEIVSTSSTQFLIASPRVGR